jgi:hypothetical protein
MHRRHVIKHTVKAQVVAVTYSDCSQRWTWHQRKASADARATHISKRNALVKRVEGYNPYSSTPLWPIMPLTEGQSTRARRRPEEIARTLAQP